MDIVRVQVLANSSEKDKRDALVKKLDSINYLRIESPLDTGLDLIDSMVDDVSDVVLMFEHYNGNGYISSQQITSHYPSKSVILIKSDRSQANIREIVRSGASDIVPYDVDIQKLTEIIYETHKTNINKQEVMKSEKDLRLAQEGKVYTVFSTKGGTGTTFVATNLATKLAQDESARVVLMDLDFDYGGVAMSFNLSAETSIMDAVEDTQHLDSDLMESYLEEHKSGVHVLAGNSRPDLGEYIGADQVEIIINILKQSFDYVVIDMPGRFMEPINPAFTFAHTVLLVTTPEVLALKNTGAALNVFEDLDYTMDNIKIVLNKVAFGGISRRDVETTLGETIFVEIPEDSRRIRKSQNEGTPYVNQYKNTAVTKAFDKILQDGRFKTK